MPPPRKQAITLTQLRILLAIADHGGFGDAALHLQMSQSAVSHAIATLEEQLGVVLLSRGRYGARLTPVGERIVTHARQIEQELEAIGREANLAKGLEGGQVRITSFRSVATHILPEVIVRFSQRYPAIDLSLTEYDDIEPVETALRNGQADIGFTHLPPAQDFDAWELLRDEYVVLLPASFRPAGPDLTWEELVSYPLIMPPEEDSTLRSVYTHCQQFGYTLTVAYRVKTDSTIVGLVAQGLGAAILPQLAAAPIPPEIQVFSLPMPLFRVIHVIVLANALQVPAVFAFLEMLRSHARLYA